MDNIDLAVFALLVFVACSSVLVGYGMAVS